MNRFGEVTLIHQHSYKKGKREKKKFSGLVPKRKSAPECMETCACEDAN